MRTVECVTCHDAAEVANLADAIIQGWRRADAGAWMCTWCAAVDDAVERDVDDAIDDRSAS